MREYFKDIPKLVAELEDQKSFENIIKLITKFSSENLGNRSKAFEPGNLKKDEQNQFACGSFILIDDSINLITEGEVNLEKSSSVGVGGLNSYYTMNKAIQLPFPRLSITPASEMDEFWKKKS